MVDVLEQSRRRLWLRILLAGPLTIVTSVTVMLGGACWLPQGAAQIDRLILPIVLFPAIWGTLFFHACLDSRLVRAYAIQGLLLVWNAALIAPPLT